MPFGIGCANSRVAAVVGEHEHRTPTSLPALAPVVSTDRAPRRDGAVHGHAVVLAHLDLAVALRASALTKPLGSGISSAPGPGSNILSELFSSGSISQDDCRLVLVASAR